MNEQSKLSPLLCAMDEFLDAAYQVDLEMGQQAWQKIRDFVHTELNEHDALLISPAENALKGAPECVFWAQVGVAVGLLTTASQLGLGE